MFVVFKLIRVILSSMVLGLEYHFKGAIRELCKRTRYRVFGVVLRATLLRFGVTSNIDTMNYSLLFFIMPVKYDTFDSEYIYYAHLTASPIPTTRYEDDELKMGADPVLRISTFILRIHDIGINRETESRIIGTTVSPLKLTFTDLLLAKDQKTGTSPLALITPSSFTI